MLKIHSPLVGGFKHSFAILQCIVEAYPPAVNYWERQDGRHVQQTNFGRSKGKVIPDSKREQFLQKAMHGNITKY